MGRIRTIKPDFFRHEELFDAERETGLPLRLAFVSLWTIADREGRFKWRPRALKSDCLPFDDTDFGAVLDALQKGGFIIKYAVDGEAYGAIPTWKKHQAVNQREAKSVLPEPPQDHMHARAEPCIADDEFEHIPNGVNIPGPLRETVYARDGRQCKRCGAKEDLTVDHIFPRSVGGTHAIANLRTLCRKCNSARPVQGQGLIDDLARDGFTLDDMERICTHVQARGEGKGKEGKEAAVGGASERALDPDGALFKLGEEIVGKGCGGMIAQLKKSYGGDVAQARLALENLKGKHNPREVLAKIIRTAAGKREGPLDNQTWAQTA